MWVLDDGRRETAGFAGHAGDSVVRAIAIADETPYGEVYRALHETTLAERGWTWTPTMTIGHGCTVHLRSDELPGGRLIVRVSRHICAVIDGVIHDTHDPSRGGNAPRVRVLAAPDRAPLINPERLAFAQACARPSPNSPLRGIASLRAHACPPQDFAPSHLIPAPATADGAAPTFNDQLPTPAAPAVTEPSYGRLSTDLRVLQAGRQPFGLLALAARYRSQAHAAGAPRQARTDHMHSPVGAVSGLCDSLAGQRPWGSVLVCDDRSQHRRR